MIPRFNGGVLGKVNTPTASLPSGVWDLQSQGHWRRALADPYWSSVSLLLHCDGTDAGTTFTDSSTLAHTVSANNQAQLDTAQKKYGSASLLCDGTTDYLSVPNHTSLVLGSGDFTVECWVRPNASISGDVHLIGKIEGGWNSGDWQLMLRSSNAVAVRHTAGGGYMQSSNSVITSGVWYHLAWTRSGTGMTLWLDGKSVATATSSLDHSDAGALWIGSRGTSGESLNGWIDEVRITKGVARYTSAFSPPAAAFPDY